VHDVADPGIGRLHQQVAKVQIAPQSIGVIDHEDGMEPSDIP